MKKVITGLLLTLLIFTNCRRKSSNSITASDQNDTTERPPAPPESVQDSTSQTVSKFTFMPQKQNLEAGNIGIVYKEDNANILSVYVNICGGNNVFGVTFDLDYDSSKIIFKKVAEGGFLNKDGAQTNILFNGPNIGISRAGQAGAVSGDGVICIIELEAKKTFDSLAIGFTKQTATNSQGIKILSDANWFGGVLGYK
ncbi:MAG: cohesin domain-containing protein [bacterium]|nr:cohesin domain-containing protein [bacterium]